MPWTFAHAAAVLPFRRRLPLSALVVGSIAPDLSYYVGQFGFATNTHSPAGLPLCLLVGLVTLLLLQYFKPAVCNLLPQPHRGMLGDGTLPLFSDVKSTGLTLLALAVGALTHMLWDSFTHESGWFVGQIPFLQMQLALDGGRPTPVYKLAQHMSTAIGVIVLALFYILSLRRAPGYPWPASRRGQTIRIVLIAALACISVLIAAAWLLIDGRDRSVAAFIFHFALSSTSVFTALFLGVAVLVRHRLPVS
jgi:hypothetical protein